jgi:predicted metal-binding membrane protein
VSTPAQPSTTLTERVVRREQVVIAAALVLITALAWTYVLTGAGTGMSTIAMTTWQFPPPRPAAMMAGDWNAAYWLIMLVMWWVMMIAMMIPSAAPMILLYARVFRQGQARGQISGALVPTASFAAGYLVCWLGFSALATALQFALEQIGLVHGMWMWSTSRWLTAALLIVAGIFQLTWLKSACLEHCRAPASFLAEHWRSGRGGAFRLGLVHGAYCLGCCWALMLLLFAAGIMNLVWIAGLAILVLVEKLAPFGGRLAPITATLLIGAGVYVGLA